MSVKREVRGYLPVFVCLLAVSPLLAQKGAPRALRGGAGAAKRLPNPGNMAQRLAQMTPEQRERILRRLPPERQGQLRQRLERFESLPKEEQERAIERYQAFTSLSPEKQNLVRRQIRSYNALPPERRRVIAPELQKLRRMPDSERQARLASDNFKQHFSPDEQQMLADLSENLPLPQR